MIGTWTHDGGRHNAGASEIGSGRVRWRIAERVISVGIGGAALSGAVYLGLTGPLVSPVAAAPVSITAEAVSGSGADATSAEDPSAPDTADRHDDPRGFGADHHDRAGRGGR